MKIFIMACFAIALICFIAAGIIKIYEILRK